MRLLCIGDVCGDIGCRKVRECLPGLKKQEKIDVVIINGENSADGNGMTPESVMSLSDSGADVITGGNHSMRRKSVYSLLDENEFLLRPENYPEAEYGSGYCLVDKGRYLIAVINILGQAFMNFEKVENPFEVADRLLGRAENDGAAVTIIDFHGEATGEKKAFGYYVDGRASVVFGTHTHVQTADIGILPKGTGFITDVGMTGPVNSVLGVKPEIIIDRLKNGVKGKFELSNGECMMNGCIFDIDISTGKTVGYKNISL